MSGRRRTYRLAPEARQDLSDILLYMERLKREAAENVRKGKPIKDEVKP
jgi:hypothetical protein